ncbi:hypothetical protein IF1G_08756 [Cordyceps javanica]|uniref:Uncharacterized protein n=1 Tax=Cordyceps javanica TaxID=43265 RepID=A0A545UTP0_9HYPO|nr:hypothetical protein IF1G_08756 [Cordyceps javanica]
MPEMKRNKITTDLALLFTSHWHAIGPQIIQGNSPLAGSICYSFFAPAFFDRMFESMSLLFFFGPCLVPFRLGLGLLPLLPPPRLSR